MARCMKTLGPADGPVHEDSGARGVGRGAGGRFPSSPQLRAPRAHRVACQRAREPVLQHLASSLPLPPGRQKGERRVGSPGATSGPAFPSAAGLPRGARLARLALRCVCQSSPGVSARPGRGGRAVRAGCRGRGRAGERGGNPRLVLPLPGSLSLSPRGAGDWQPSPVTHSPRVHIPGEGSRKVINLHQATFPIT